MGSGVLMKRRRYNRRRYPLILLCTVIAGLIVLSAFRSRRTAPAIDTHCDPSDIAINSLRSSSDRLGFVRMTGLLTNTCEVPVRVQVKITTYDKVDSVLTVSDIWPEKHIRPHDSFPFQWMERISEFDRFEARVATVIAWRDPRALR